MSVFHQRVLALYCRITEDVRGKKEGVAAQERRGRAFGEIEFPDLPIEVFADNDITAADPDVIRPEFERLREWIRAGRVAAVWSIEWFRLVRLAPQWFDLSAELEAAGINEIYTHRDGIVRVDDDVSDIKAVLGSREVKRTKKRVNDYNEDRRGRGLPPGSRPFGYQRAKIKGVETYEQRPEYADALAWAAEMVLESNWSLSRCAKALRERGLEGPHRRKVVDESTGEPVVDIDTGEPVTRATAISASTLKRALLAPAAAGLLAHKGEVIGRGNWYERRIISEEQRHRLLVKLGGARMVATSNGGQYPVSGPRRQPRRRYLLTGGVAVCDVCTAPLIASLKSMRGGRRVPYYSCHPSRGGRGCVGIMADPLEAHVVEQMMTELAKPGRIERHFSDPYADDRARLAAELADIEVRRGELATMWGARQITSEEWRPMRAGLDEDESRLRAELAAVPPPPSRDLDPRVILDPRVWAGLELDEQRGFIERFVECVTVSRATPPYGAFDSGRVAIVYR